MHQHCVSRRKRGRPSSGPHRCWTQRRWNGLPPKVHGQRSGDDGAQRRSRIIGVRHGQQEWTTLLAHLLAQLEDSQTSGGDEGEEGQLERVPSLQTQHAEGQGDQGHGLQEDEHHDGDEDLLQLGLAGLGGTACGSEVDREVHFAALAGWGVGNGGVGGGNLELDVAALHKVLQLGGQVVRSGRNHVVGGSIAGHFDVAEDLKREVRVSRLW